MTDLNDELKMLFSSEFRAELQERTAECDQLKRLKAEVETNKVLWSEWAKDKAERDALRVVSKACRERNEVLCAEVERLQRAAVPGNGPEMLRMQRESGRLMAEVERLKAIAKGNGDNSLHFARKADDIATQLRALREAALVVDERWCEYTSQEMYGEMLRDGMTEPDDYERWSEAHGNMRAVLAKVKL